MEPQQQQPPSDNRVRQYRARLRNPKNHPGQTALRDTTKKKIIIRAGRRGGKTTGAAMKALQFFLAGKRVLYACPTIDQVQKFWKEVKMALDEPLAYNVYRKNETEHVIEYIGTDARIRAKTAWNAETLRGDYAELLILDEWQMMDETAWTEVGAPMLIDKNGTVVFIYTPPSLETHSASKARDPQHAAKMFKKYENDPDWLCIHFTSHQNPHLPEEGLLEVAKNMTELAYRQEILALDTEEIPGALWTRKILQDSRVTKIPCEIRRTVVAIDPSGGNRTEVGIVAACEGVDGHYYVVRDESMKAARPRAWAERACNLYRELAADRILGERNYGGDMVQETIRTVDDNVSYKDAQATKGKMVRAEPVCALFQRNKMHMVGQFPELEEELCSYTADPRQASPNRLDAMVWAGIELSGSGSLGLLEFFKSGKAQTFYNTTTVKKIAPPAGVAMEQAMNKVAGSETLGVGKTSSLAAVATNDKTPHCTKCDAVTLHVVAGGQLRCQACGHQQWPSGAPPAFPVAHRSIVLEK